MSTLPCGRQRVVILGSGWGGCQAARDLDKSLYHVTVISPSNHFVFTPLLPSTAVGTLEFRCVQEPIRTIPGVDFHQGKARVIDAENKLIKSQDTDKASWFDVPYDKLIISVGCKTNTFNTPGIADREGKEVFFLKHLHHARQIRSRIVECFERADIPGTPPAETKRLLTFIVVGGGPTSCEFAAELHDFLREDLARWFPDLVDQASVTVVEAGDHLLGSFEASLQTYTERLFKKREINVLTNTAVKGVQEYKPDGFNAEATFAELSNGEKMPFGALVWSAGLAPVKFTEALDSGIFERSKRGCRLLVDERLQIPGQEGTIWALGDAALCSVRPLPPIAQAAQQQAKYIAKALNAEGSYHAPLSASPGSNPAEGAEQREMAARAAALEKANMPFTFFQLGAMSQLGLGEGVIDLTQLGDPNAEPAQHSKIRTKIIAGIKGPIAWLAWRSVYLGKQVSWSNKMLIPMHWLKTALFGRDISRF